MHRKIAILLSAYNGGKYLEEQLESLLGQTYGRFVIVLRDDGSGDNTPGIIESYRARHPGVVHVPPGGGRHLGACASFAFLMRYVLGSKGALGLPEVAMAFCDQDDVWAADKIERQVQCLRAAESDAGAAPVLVHSDLEVVGESGNTIAGSFVRYQGIDPKRNRFGQVLYGNPVTGSTALINEALAVRALPVPPEAVMHDWWLALAASAFGKLVFVDRPLVRYRQHPGNALGAVQKPPRRSLAELASAVYGLRPDPSVTALAAQAGAFLERYGASLGTGQKIRLRLTAVLRTRSGAAQRVFRRLGRRL